MAMARKGAPAWGPRSGWLGLLVLSLGGMVWACGGKAIVDEMVAGSGGASSSSSSTGNQGGSPICATPAPTGALEFCGGSSSGGAGAPIECVSFLCDQADNMWESECSTTGCRCYYNSQLMCSCTHQGSGSLCTGSAPACCPAPFPE
ncbi:MAG: hypothetical protein JRI68_06720 [Deltaproteobacteria bacterium]|nr:hypothetical protein [Deltaproteobacteria bacterium]